MARPATQTLSRVGPGAEPGRSSLNDLPLLQDFETRSISAENPDGAKGGGAKGESTGKDAARLLGRGWKVRPCLTLPAGSTTTLADIEGPGVINHIWITVQPARSAPSFRSCAESNAR